MTDQEEQNLTEEKEVKESNFNDFCMPSISIEDIFDRSLLPNFE